MFDCQKSAGRFSLILLVLSSGPIFLSLSIMWNSNKACYVVGEVGEVFFFTRVDVMVLIFLYIYSGEVV